MGGGAYGTDGRYFDGSEARRCFERSDEELGVGDCEPSKAYSFSESVLRSCGWRAKGTAESDAR